MHFNKFLAFLKCFKCARCQTKRFNSTVTDTSDMLKKRLDLSPSKSTLLALKLKLYDSEIHQLKDTFVTLESFGYSKQEILDDPHILKQSKRKLCERRALLEEVGFADMSLVVLYSFRKLVNKKISWLKLSKFIPPHVNVPESLVMYLHPKPVDSFTDDLTEDSILSQVLVSILKRYLMWRLEASSDEIETFFRIYSSNIKYKSLRTICENIEIAFDMGFTPRKLLGFGYLLAADPKWTKEVLEKMPSFAGADMKTMLRRYPKLVTVNPKQYPIIYKILKDAGIPDSAIQKQMNIFTLSPETVKSRLNDLKETPEMNVLRYSPRVLRLIIHYNRAKSRLSFMHQLQLKCASMCLLDHDDENYFNSHVRNTKDTNVLVDITRLLQHLLNSDASEIEYNLKRHPHHLQVPLVNIEKTCKHVQKSFSNNSIIKVVPILLYPSEKIDAALNQIKSMNDLPQGRLTEAKRLNLALYLIEKEHHFTGDGVWENSQIVEGQ